jgi:FkbH-like protein
MVGRVHRPAEADMARIAQLEMKTNQFNVTTRRYSEPALRAFMERDDAIVLALWLADRFGDHGLVSTLIALREGHALRIDSWLMSCRVFSRGAEQFVMRELVDIARAQGAARIVGEFVATERNGVVADLWSRLGFASQSEGLWTRDAAADPGDLAHSISK